VFGHLGLDQERKYAFAFFSVFATASIFYSQEARMYSLMTFLLLAAVLALLTRRWVWLFLISTALLYTQNYALFYVPSLWIAGMIRDRHDWKPITMACGLAGVAWLPWLPTLLQQQNSLSAGYWISPFTPGVALNDLLLGIQEGSEFRMDLFVMVVMFGWACYAFWWYILGSGFRSNLIPAVLGFTPWLFAILGSLILGTSIMHFRSFVPCAPFVIYWLMTPITTNEPLCVNEPSYL
jgi:hypothetical protein